MLKYLYIKETSQKIPSETCLAISISGCSLRCKGCPNRELWEDKGTPLDESTLQLLLKQHKEVSCLLILGGEHDMDSIIKLFIYAHKRIKTAWYCSLDNLPKNKTGILRYLDYYKLGHYDMELGGLESPSTNQRLYKLKHRGDGNYWETNITHLITKEQVNNQHLV